jgi:hypothetical protein
VINNVGGLIQGTGDNSFGISSSYTNGPVTVTNSGTITASSGIILGGSVSNNATGSIVATTGFAIRLPSGGAVTILNAGTISSETNNAMFFENGTNGSLTNNSGGVITSGDIGHSAVFATGRISVSNTDQIFGVTTGINLSAGGSILNTGFITGQGGSAVTISVGGTATIVNSGTISSSSGAGIDFETPTSGSVTNNPGAVIAGGSGHSGILGGTCNITVSNQGTINGPVNLGSGSNTVTLFTVGRINGALNLGPNSGTLILDGTGVQTIGQAVTGMIRDLGSLTKQGER